MLAGMSEELQRVIEAAMKLGDRERAELVTILTDGIGEGLPDDEILAAWVAESQRRLEDIRSGRVPTSPADEVFAKGQAMLERMKPQASTG
jgi:putative addiction module component (TIGR02574 family)